MFVTSMRGRAAHVRDKRSPPGAANQSANTMMSYTFIPSLIYNAGEVASAWAVVALLFGLLALT